MEEKTHPNDGIIVDEKIDIEKEVEQMTPEAAVELFQTVLDGLCALRDDLTHGIAAGTKIVVAIKQKYGIN